MHGETPAIETLMQEVRSGLDDTTLSEATATTAQAGVSLQADLRQASESASVLGRCGGSLRGRLCLRLAPLVLPVIEQLNRFHSALLNGQTKLAGEHTATARHIADLEQRVSALEQRMPPPDGDRR